MHSTRIARNSVLAVVMAVAFAVTSPNTTVQAQPGCTEYTCNYACDWACLHATVCAMGFHCTDANGNCVTPDECVCAFTCELN